MSLLLEDFPTDGLSLIRPDFQRNDQKMPLVSHPLHGGMTRYYRPSSYGKSIEDDRTLNLWIQRQIVLGMAESHALVARALAADPNEVNYRDEINKIATDAQAVAKSHERADIGTALHLMIKRASLGQTLSLPEPFASDLEAYFACLETNNLEVVDGLVEMNCVHDDMKLAGTFDVVVRHRDSGLLYCGDLKTGSSLQYSHIAYGTQLWIYAHSQLYDTATNQRTDTPDLNKSVALIFHLPAASGKCTLHTVHLGDAGEAVELVKAVRKMRYRTILEVAQLVPLPTSPAPAVLDEPPPDFHLQWLVGRYEAIKAHGTAALTELARTWPFDVPSFKKATDQTPDQLKQIEQCMTRVESKFLVPFGDTEPTVTSEPPVEAAPESAEPSPDEGGPADPDMVRVLRERYSKLSEEALSVVNGWTQAARTAGGDLSVTRNPSVRRCELARGFQTFIEAGVKDTEDPVVRAAVALVLGDDLVATVPTGAYFARFDRGEATELADLAYKIVSGAMVVHFRDDCHVALEPVS